MAAISTGRRSPEHGGVDARRPGPGGRWRGAGRVVAGNVAARIIALIALAGSTVIVARIGGPGLVGAFTLIRVLPGLVGVVAAFGVPGAAPYFLASQGDDPRLRSTMMALTVLGAAAGALAWLAASPVLRQLFFASWTMVNVSMAALAVFFQLFVAAGKACLQGCDDLRGANAAIALEELVFIPVYVFLLLCGTGSMSVMLVIALVIADVVVAVGIAERLRRSGFFHGWLGPDLALGRTIAAYGLRGQVGGLLTLVNLRLDVALLGALAGPAVLGVYSVASKYAELLRLPGLALNYVLYPAFARSGHADARTRTRALLPMALVVNAVVALPLVLAAATVFPMVYGTAFLDAVVPTWILLGGLLGESAAGLISAYLYGVRRPGLNSLAIGAGVLVTVAGDLLLIPRHGVIGAAVASAIAYLSTMVVLMACFVAVEDKQECAALN